MVWSRASTTDRCAGVAVSNDIIAVTPAARPRRASCHALGFLGLYNPPAPGVLPFLMRSDKQHLEPGRYGRQLANQRTLFTPSVFIGAHGSGGCCESRFRFVIAIEVRDGSNLRS